MEILNVFDSVDMLEPRCPKCKMVLDYGTNTKFDEKTKRHICMKCGEML